VRNVKRSQKVWTWKMAHICAQTHDSQTWEIHRSIRPQDIIPVLKDGMSPEIRNYPRIRVDAKLGISWGTLHKYDENFDYSVLFEEWDRERAERIRTMKELIEAPEYRVEQAVMAMPESPYVPLRIMFDPGKAISTNDVENLTSVLIENPGRNTLVVVRNGTEKALNKYPTSIDLKQAQAMLMPLFPQCSITIDSQAALEQAMTNGHTEAPEPELVGALPDGNLPF